MTKLVTDETTEQAAMREREFARFAKRQSRLSDLVAFLGLSLAGSLILNMILFLGYAYESGR